MPFAEVVVDLAADAVDRRFTYRIPDDLPVSVGDMVSAPFGPRTLEGFVVSVKDEPGMDESRVRPLKGVAAAGVILPELIELAEWMKKRYNCLFVDALRLLIPSEMRGARVKEKSVRVAALSMPVDEAAKACARAPKQLELLSHLTGGAKPTAYLAQMVPGAAAAIQAMAKKGVLTLSETRERRAPRMDDGGRSREDPALMPGQQRAADEMISALRSGGGRFLLHGVTGSGKTEVYIRLIRAVLADGKGAIVLVPEIALTPQMVGWFHARFGADAAVIHSRLSAGERFDEWERIRRGEARVVIGARSAVFAPVEKLGAVIVDEEHEGAYQSEKRPRYDAREIAWRRCETNGGVLVLGSATPSIASYMRVMPGVKPQNRLTLLELTERVLGRKMPECHVVDMRRELEMGNHGIFSAELVKELRACTESGKQTMLFINRRGHSTFVSCRACGHVEKCAFCDVAMTYHQSDGRMHCHYCGQSKEPPTTCPECGSSFIKYFGAGTQRVEEEVRKLLPGVPVARMDVDTTQGKDGHLKLLEAFRKGETRVMVGTQMIAKGLDFPNVTLVGVVAADTTLNLPDYRSAERTFQLITQVAGRAGRADSPGRVIIQTYTPDHYAIRCAVKQDYRTFYHTEAGYRKRALYPPYTVLARLVVLSKDERIPALTAMALEQKLTEALTNEGLMDGVLLIHAAEAPIKKLRGETRWQVYVKMYARGEVERITAEMEKLAETGAPGARIEMEVNPANMI